MNKSYIYRHWNRAIERTEALGKLGIPEEDFRYLIDMRLIGRYVVLKFNRLSKDPNGVDLIEHEWTRKIHAKTMLVNLGLTDRHGNLQAAWSFMGVVELRFTERIKG